MKLLLFGATGMVGCAALLECLEDARVEQVLVVGRTSCAIAHPKVREILHKDFHDFTALQREFMDRDACVFAIGVPSGGMTEAEYSRVTYDIAVAVAKSALAANPRMTFCFVSGEGADSTEKKGVMWARVKGRTENALLAMPFKAVYVFRPGFILPVKGVKTRVALYRATYALFGPLYPLLRPIFPQYMTTSEVVGKALIQAAIAGAPARMLHTPEITALAAHS